MGEPQHRVERHTFRDWIWYQRRSAPDSIAVIDGESGRTWRYEDVDRLAETLAGQLRAAGIGRGERLGALLPTGAAFVHLVHASQRGEIVLAPLNVRQTPARLHDRIDHLDLAGVICDSKTRAAIETVDPPCRVFEIETGGADPRIRSIDPVPIDPPTWRPSDPTVVLGTSGTTGRPKAVVLTVGNLVASATASAFRLGVLPEDRWLCCLPMYHMGGLAPVYRSSLYGTATVVVPGDGFDPAETARIAEKYEVTGISMVPTMLERTLGGDHSFPGSLRFLLLGGGPIPPGLVRRAADRDIPICPTYGASETSSQVATARPTEAVAHPETVGRPLPGVVVTVVDDDGAPVEPGTVGELVVSGPTIMDGYYRAPEATAGSIGRHGFHTGDLGAIDVDGRLTIRGRRGDRIVTGGENVDPSAVESVIESHPSVGRATVVGIPDEEWGETVAALVVPSADRGDVSAAEIRTYCAERLSDFEVPKRIVIATDLPTTASGTVDREAARRRLRDDGS